jgi:hypothetical protein
MSSWHAGRLQPSGPWGFCQSLNRNKDARRHR